MLKINLDCKIVWEMLTTRRLKDSQRAMDGGSMITKTIELETE